MEYFDIINRFNEITEYNKVARIKTQKSQQQVIDLLEEFLVKEKDIPVELAVWGYWNISDNYALLRDNNKTYENHLKFEKYLADKNPKYLLMLICDTTQRLSINASGHSEYWNKLYYKIMNSAKVTSDNYNIYFQVLRTAIVEHEFNSNNEEIKIDAIKKMESMLTIIENFPDKFRMKLLYCSLKIKYNYFHNYEDENILKESFALFLEIYKWLKIENVEEEKENHIKTPFGTYESWNEERTPYIQARCIHDYIISLIDTKHFEIAKKCYELIGKDEFTNKYFVEKIKQLYQHYKC